jgi:hypothetical protein
MSAHVYIAYGIGTATARLYQRLFMSTLGHINYKNINVLFIATLLYINLQYQSSKPVLRICTIFFWPDPDPAASGVMLITSKYFVNFILFFHTKKL